MKRTSLAYGSTAFLFEIPPDAQTLAISDPPSRIDGEGFRQKLRLEFQANTYDLGRILVVVADKTRLCDYDTYLPVLLDTLVETGASPDSIMVAIAYGTHAAQSREESLRAYGPVFDRFRWIQHDCTDSAAFSELGKTSRGTPVRIRRDITESSLVITFGAMSHHYFAGYGGGRKLLFPGLAEKAAVYHNHGLFLDRTTGKLHPACQPGVLDGNPVAEDLREIREFRPSDIDIYGILDSGGAVSDLLVGSGYEHFLAAADEHAQSCEIRSSRRYDLVVASCGGYPKDINLIQAHKAIHNASMWVRDGGELIVLAECRDGIGSKTFLPWFDFPGRSEAFAALAGDYRGNGGTALSFMEKRERIRIGMVTDLSIEECRKIGVARLVPQEVQTRIGSAATVALIPNASLLVKR